MRGESSFSGRSILRPLDEITSEGDILARFYSMYGQAKEAAADAISRANRNWMMFLGHHFLRQSGSLDWIEERQSPTHTRYRREIIQPTIELLRGILVKSFPLIRVKPDYEYANLRSWIGMGNNQRFELQDLHDADVAAWATQFYMDEMVHTGEATKQAELVCQVLVEGEAYRQRVTRHVPGYGTEIRAKLLRRDQFYGDPSGTDLEQWLDFEYIIVEDELDAANIKRLYGVDERSYSYDAYHRGVAFDEGTSLSSTSRAWYPDARDQNGGTWRWDQRKYKVHTLYYNMGNVNATIFGVKNTGESAKLNYPLGREIVIVNMSKVVSDTVNPHWHGEFPVTCYQSAPLPCMARGLSEVDKIADTQTVVDIINNVCLWNALAHSNITIAYEEGSVVPSNIKNEPGLKLPVRPGALQNNQIERWEAAQMPRDLYAFGQDSAQWAQEIVSGATEALQGNRLPAGSSGELYRQNTQSGLSRHSFKARNLEEGHKRDARLWFYGIQQEADFRSPRYARLHNLGAHQYLPEAVRDLFFDMELTSMADMPQSFLEKYDFAMIQVQNGYWDLEQMQQYVDAPMRPELRELIRQTSLNHFIPGIPANIQAQLRLQAAQLMAQQQQQQTGQQVQNVAQGNPPPLPPGAPQGIMR